MVTPIIFLAETIAKYIKEKNGYKMSASFYRKCQDGGLSYLPFCLEIESK